MVTVPFYFDVYLGEIHVTIIEAQINVCALFFDPYLVWFESKLLSPGLCPVCART
jgi:hypothetical protein